MRGSIALAALLVLSACSDDAEFTEDEYMAYDGEEYAGETYSEFDERRDEMEGERGSYAGYGCTVDCSGHDAGYQWAADNGITDPDNCGGKSWSFIEGCRAYAEENGGY
jgi:hypothetical protein